MYQKTDQDIILLGDLNAKIGNANECKSVWVMNGRFTSNDYTCISNKGKSVADYVYCPYDTAEMVKDFFL